MSETDQDRMVGGLQLTPEEWVAYQARQIAWRKRQRAKLRAGMVKVWTPRPKAAGDVLVSVVRDGHMVVPETFRIVDPGGFGAKSSPSDS